MDETYTHICHIIKEENLFLNPDLNSKMVSKKLNISNQLLMEVLKKKDITFLTFINGYRVTDFINKLNSNLDKIHTLDSLAEESGFKSRATFYRVLKKHAGLSPTEYKKEHIQ